jgi:hypothetical protein
MKTFLDWVNEHQNLPASVDGPGLGDLSNSALPEIIKVAWLKYRKQTEAFFHGLAQQDEDIKYLFERLTNKPTQSPTDFQDVVIPGQPNSGGKDLPPF